MVEASKHAVASYYVESKRNKALFVLPDWSDARWWPALAYNSVWHCVEYAAGTRLFTAPATSSNEKRRRPTGWGIIMVLLCKPTVAGLRTPWKPRSSTQPPTVVNAREETVNVEKVAKRTLSAKLTKTQGEEMQNLLVSYADRFATGMTYTTGRTNEVTYRIGTGNAA